MLNEKILAKNSENKVLKKIQTPIIKLGKKNNKKKFTFTYGRS